MKLSRSIQTWQSDPESKLAFLLVSLLLFRLLLLVHVVVVMVVVIEVVIEVVLNHSQDHLYNSWVIVYPCNHGIGPLDH